MEAFELELNRLEQTGNLRTLPQADILPSCIDFVSNDYLGIGIDKDLHREFYNTRDVESLQMTASGSRLLAPSQNAGVAFEHTLQEAYGYPALLFNSGYHANTGLIPALVDNNTVIIADRLVHASIIDGIKLAGVPFERFRHNNLPHLQKLAAKYANAGKRILIVIESVYSMDGDKAPVEEITRLKLSLPDAILYVDEAHAVGVKGRAGLGLVNDLSPELRRGVDIVVGTMGKALASVGAYAILSDTMKRWAVNKARSFIFSTALPPINIEWSNFVFCKAMAMDDRRNHLAKLGQTLGQAIGSEHFGHIQPFIVGDAHLAIEAARLLAENGFNILPIRTPTVPPGTERLRISLSAAHNQQQIEALAQLLNRIKTLGK